MFYKVGATANKACILEPNKCSSLTDGTHSIPSLLDLMGGLVQLESGSLSYNLFPCHKEL